MSFLLHSAPRGRRGGGERNGSSRARAGNRCERGGLGREKKKRKERKEKKERRRRRQNSKRDIDYCAETQSGVYFWDPDNRVNQAVVLLAAPTSPISRALNHLSDPNSHSPPLSTRLAPSAHPSFLFLSVLAAPQLRAHIIGIHIALCLIFMETEGSV